MEQSRFGIGTRWAGSSFGEERESAAAVSRCALVDAQPRLRISGFGFLPLANPFGVRASAFGFRIWSAQPWLLSAFGIRHSAVGAAWRSGFRRSWTNGPAPCFIPAANAMDETNSLIEQRKAKLAALRAKGIDPFKNKFAPA